MLIHAVEVKADGPSIGHSVPFASHQLTLLEGIHALENGFAAKYLRD